MPSRWQEDIDSTGEESFRGDGVFLAKFFRRSGDAPDLPGGRRGFSRSRTADGSKSRAIHDGEHREGRARFPQITGVRAVTNGRSRKIPIAQGRAYRYQLACVSSF
jgi:hypothetical protein